MTVSAEPTGIASELLGPPSGVLEALAHIRIVLVSPSHPGNIGSVARAMKVMALSRLVLVAPRNENALTDPEALALATGASDLLASAAVHPTLDAALTGCHWAVAMTARLRDLSPTEMTPRDASIEGIRQARQGNEIAFVFGNERYGLDNDDVLRCQVCCTVPTSASFTSLNLAQAVQIVAYECQIAWRAASPAPNDDGLGRLSTSDEREQFLDHLEQVLVATEFLEPTHPKKLMSRLRRLFSRAPIEHDEMQILRGICTAILASVK